MRLVARGSWLAARGSWLVARGSVLRELCSVLRAPCSTRRALRCAASFCVVRCVALRRAWVVLRRAASHCCAACMRSWELMGTCGNFGLCSKCVEEPEYSMKRTPVTIYIIISNKHRYLQQCTNSAIISNNLQTVVFLNVHKLENKYYYKPTNNF